jgi:hypothetical protein
MKYTKQILIAKIFYSWSNSQMPCSTIRSSLNPSSHSWLEESLEIQSLETKYLDADRDADIAAMSEAS